MDYDNILTSSENGIALITINRPAKLNALNKATIQELHNALELFDSTPEIRAIIIIGSGDKAFVAGADISEFANFSISEGTALAAQGQELLFDFIENLRTPVIAAMNGFALGGGLELAMACHLRIASENSKMGLPEVSLGLIPGYGGTQRLAQLIGRGRAMEMIMTAGMITADDAYRAGLVNHVVPQLELLDFTNGIAQRIIKNSPTAITQAIKAINANYQDGLNGYKTEIAAFGHLFGTKDFTEGTTAFLEKRKPDFNGE